MSQTIDVNGQSINYPETGDTNWGDEATDFAIQTSAAFGKLGLASGTSVDVAQTLDVTGNTTLDANLSVGGDASVTGNTTLTGNLSVNGNSTLGNGTSDTTAITGILNVDSGVLYVDPTNNRVGINDANPSVELDVNGSALISGTLGVTGATSLSSTLGVTGDVAVNTNKFNVTASSGNTTIAGTLGVSGNTTIDGVTYLDDDTTANTPVLSFTGDTNTGIGRSAADTLDFITNGNSRFRIEATGQIKAVYESQVGTDYNTQLDNGYLCRAWVNFDGTGTFSPNPSSTKIRASGNVSSVTDNGTGDYTVNFTTAMPDANYALVGNTGTDNGRCVISYLSSATYLAGSCRFRSIDAQTSGPVDQSIVSIGIFR